MSTSQEISLDVQPSGNNQRTNLTDVFAVLLPWLLPLLLVAAVFAKVCQPIESSSDDWWHLKTGKVLLDHWREHGFGFPENDVFSISGENLPWANHEWLSDTLMYLGYDHLGLVGLIVVKSLIVVAAYLLLYWLILRRLSTPLNKGGRGDFLLRVSIAAVGAVTAFLASQFTMYLRPPILTYFFIAVQLHLMLNLERSANPWRSASFWLMPLLMIPWVNLHGGAILGIVLLGLQAVGTFCDALWDRYFSGKAFCLGKTFFWGVATGIMLLASLVNPFGYDIILLTAKVMKNALLVETIGELQSPNFHFTKHYEIIILLFLILLILGRRLCAVQMLPTLFFLHQSLKFVRHLPIFALVASPVVFGEIGSWIQERSLRLRRVAAGVFIFAVVLLSVQAARDGWRDELSRCLEHEGFIEEAFPVRSVNFLEYAKPEGPLFNPINFSGYLIWRLSPEKYKVFTDSRFDIHGSGAMIECLAVEDVERLSAKEAAWKKGMDEKIPGDQWDTPYWKYVLDKYGFNIILTASDSRLSLYLEGNARGWIEVFREPQKLLGGQSYNGYSVFLRDCPKNSEIIKKSISQ